MYYRNYVPNVVKENYKQTHKMDYMLFAIIFRSTVEYVVLLSLLGDHRKEIEPFWGDKALFRQAFPLLWDLCSSEFIAYLI